MLEGTPAGFSVVRIADPVANVIPRWRCGDSGETVEATRDLIADVIAKKDPLVPLYRATVPRVFLLIASNFADFANNFYVRGNLSDWQFDFSFDKVLLLTSEQGVFDLQRNDH